MSEKSRDDMKIKSKELLDIMKKRRSVRAFSEKEVPEEAIINCISIAATAPSGANTQPWSFVLVKDKATKRLIRAQAEAVEKNFYKDIITEEWSNKLKPLATNAEKAFLEEAPYLICIFTQKYGFDEDGKKSTHYYPDISVGLATGILISSLHQIGLATLTYTPAPMTFIKDLLKRPDNETPYMIIIVGYSEDTYIAPGIKKKNVGEYLTII